ncbi:MAG: hypothetical protein KDC66_07120 [Phaeodactylibacter sp.]|nr:hypothetical protein [Phaeodactylibacter sp.]
MANTIETYIDFIQNQLPGLKSGDYTVEVSQSFQPTAGAQPVYFPASNQPASLDFSIRGERFALNPADIISVFPPANSLGEHSSIFPQVVFARNTLPWERMIAEPKGNANDKGYDDERKKVEMMPWMALLVFNEEELQHPSPDAKRPEIENGTVTNLAELSTRVGSNFPNYNAGTRPGYPTLESDEKDEDTVTLIYAKKQLLQQLLPSAENLAQLCHARESSLRLNLQDSPAEDSLYYELRDAKGQLAHAGHVAVIKGTPNQQVSLGPGQLKAGDYSVKAWIGNNAIQIAPEALKISANDDFGHKVAIVPANRLPRPGARSIVHLVSLEERYYWDGSQYSFYFGTAKDESLIALASLKTWSFNCVTETHNFDKMLVQLIESGKGDTLNTLRLPLQPNPQKDAGIDAANSFLKSGYAPLPHFFRRGGKSISWYRGPLLPGNKPKSSLPADFLPATCSDALLLYDEQYGMFDVSYAAAWELGRLLALKNKSISASLYRWKLLHHNLLKLAEQQEQHPHLPFHREIQDAGSLPEEVEDWFSALGLLKGLPFNYLVPDERMLPKESFRFFQLDPDWISCLIDGAFSLGRRAPAGPGQQGQQKTGEQAQVVSGFLLRSFVVKGWPKLQADGYKQKTGTAEEMDAAKLKILSISHLSPTVLLCLFEGDALAVDIHQKPEMLHLGFDIPASDNPDRYTKALRNADGLDKNPNNNNKPWATEILDSSDWDPQNRVLHISHLYKDINDKKSALSYTGNLASAQFALSMVEGVQKVRFVRGPN